MSSFNAPLICEDSDNEKYRRVYVEFSYERGRLGSGDLITVPKLFITDGASIPPFLQSITGLSPWGDYAKAAVLHDWLYASQIYTRLESDHIFVEAMMALKINSFKANLMFKMVDWFAESAWEEHIKRGDPQTIAAGQIPQYKDAIFSFDKSLTLGAI